MSSSSRATRIEEPVNQSRFRRFYNSIRNIQKGIVVPLSYSLGYGKAPDPDFEKMINLYLSSPYVKGAIDELAESAVGNGYFLTAKDQDVLKECEDFAETINLDGMLQTMARELWATGNWIAEAEPSPTNLQTIIELPISSIKRFKVEMHGKVNFIHQQMEGTRRNIPYQKVLHSAWNKIDASVWGHGLLDPVLRQGIGYQWRDANGTLHTDYAPSFQSILEENHDSMRKVLRRYVPRHVYVFKRYGDNVVRDHANTIKSMRPEDELIISAPNKEQDVVVTRQTSDPRSRLDPFVEYFHNGLITALETPTLKLFLEAGFTEASARTAVEIRDRKISAFRRFIKRFVEAKIFKARCLTALDWNPQYADARWKKAELRLNWNPMEQPQLETKDLMRLVEISSQSRIPYITAVEVRRILKKRGVELDESITDDEVRQSEKINPSPFPLQPPNIPFAPKTPVQPPKEKEKEEEEEEEKE